MCMVRGWEKPLPYIYFGVWDWAALTGWLKKKMASIPEERWAWTLPSTPSWDGVHLPVLWILVVLWLNFGQETVAEKVSFLSLRSWTKTLLVRPEMKSSEILSLSLWPFCLQPESESHLTRLLEDENPCEAKLSVHTGSHSRWSIPSITHSGWWTHTREFSWHHLNPCQISTALGLPARCRRNNKWLWF